MSSLNRRGFLASSTALASGIAAVSGLSSAVHVAAAEADDLKSIGKTPHTKFAVNCEMWWTKLPFMDRIKETAKLGFPAIEFWPYANKNILAVAELCEELGVQVAQFTAWGFKPGMNELQNHDAVEQAIRESVKVAKILKCNKACVVAGNDVPGMTQEEMHKNVITALKRVAPIAEDNDLTLILEPMNRSEEHTSDWSSDVCSSDLFNASR